MHLFILSRFPVAHKFPMAQTLNTDVLVIGGGVAGLWLLNRLHAEGCRAWLLEQDALGSGQSIASQGMIHGGIKYALGGKLTGASNTIADMPAHWRACLAGKGDVDLRGCQLLSDAYYMWPRRSVRSRLNAFLGSKALEARVTTVAPADYPAFFRNNIDGPLYRLQDIVLDVPSLLRTLADNCSDSLFAIDWTQAAFDIAADGRINGLQLANGCRIIAQHYVFCAGSGNAGLLQRCNLDIAPMQRRPLRMVMVRHHIADPVYVHCVSDKLTTTPEVTITSHRTGNGDAVWYLGGELAEQGARQQEEELIETAQAKLADLFPWCDFTAARFATLAIDRAELQQPGGKRPDDASVVQRHNLVVGWPTKLTLAPAFADTVIARLQAQGLAPTPATGEYPGFLARPIVAATPWEHL